MWLPASRPVASQPDGQIFVMGAPLHIGLESTRADALQTLETARQQLALALNDLGNRAMALANGQMCPSVSPAKDQTIPG